ncbi:MAG: LysR family transcriptional regulator, partial [Peptococcaceae bacterium]|nr:LysR family transcriptional regulator [Peptococcaceae bacterium]
MRIEQLHCIVDIAETGSITATAQRQFVTQQAVSKTIKQLEKELNATLLIRTRTGVSFTEIGKELVTFA